MTNDDDSHRSSFPISSLLSMEILPNLTSLIKIIFVNALVNEDVENETNDAVVCQRQPLH